ncbi:MAG: GAF domain-containing protein, partial [Actinomycetes bacterium]
MSDADSVYQRRSHLVDGQTVPDAGEFAALAAIRRVVPVVRRLLADGETPIGLYRKLARNRPGTYLLESAEHGRVWSRYSFVGVRCSAMLTQVGGSARWVGTAPVGIPGGGPNDGRTALDVLRDTVAALHSPRIAGLPPLTSGLVGAIGYDAVRHWERLPELTTDDLHLPEIAMLLASDLAVLDHQDGSVMLIANAFIGDSESDPHAVRQLYSDPELAGPTRAIMDKYGDLSYLNVPLVYGGQSFGVMVLVETEVERQWSDEEVALARALGEQAAVAIEHARLYRRVQDQAITDGLTGLFN